MAIVPNNTESQWSLTFEVRKKRTVDSSWSSARPVAMEPDL